MACPALHGKSTSLVLSALLQCQGVILLIFCITPRPCISLGVKVSQAFCSCLPPNIPPASRITPCPWSLGVRAAPAAHREGCLQTLPPLPRHGAGGAAAEEDTISLQTLARPSSVAQLITDWIGLKRFKRPQPSCQEQSSPGVQTTQRKPKVSPAAPMQQLPIKQLPGPQHTSGCQLSKSETAPQKHLSKAQACIQTCI